MEKENRRMSVTPVKQKSSSMIKSSLRGSVSPSTSVTFSHHQNVATTQLKCTTPPPPQQLPQEKDPEREKEKQHQVLLTAQNAKLQHELASLKNQLESREEYLDSVEGVKISFEKNLTRTQENITGVLCEHGERYEKFTESIVQRILNEQHHQQLQHLQQEWLEAKVSIHSLQQQLLQLEKEKQHSEEQLRQSSEASQNALQLAHAAMEKEREEFVKKGEEHQRLSQQLQTESESKLLDLSNEMKAQYQCLEERFSASEKQCASWGEKVSESEKRVQQLELQCQQYESLLKESANERKKLQEEKEKNEQSWEVTHIESVQQLEEFKELADKELQNAQEELDSQKNANDDVWEIVRELEGEVDSLRAITNAQRQAQPVPEVAAEHPVVTAVGTPHQKGRKMSLEEARRQMKSKRHEETTNETEGVPLSHHRQDMSRINELQQKLREKKVVKR